MGLKISRKCPKIAYVGGFLPILDPLHTISTRFPARFTTKFSHKIFHKIFPQEFPTRFSHKVFPQDFPARISHKNFTARISCKNFLQGFPRRFSHKDFPQDFSRKIFLQGFPARFSCKISLSWILIGWHPITLFQMLNFPPITTLLNRPTYHKRSKVSPPPFPQILSEPQINE